MTHVGVATVGAPRPAAGSVLLRRLSRGNTLPILAVLAAVVVVWFAGAVYLNAPRTIEAFDRQELDWTFGDLVDATWSMDRPVLPTPLQVFRDLWSSTVETSISPFNSIPWRPWRCAANPAARVVPFPDRPVGRGQVHLSQALLP